MARILFILFLVIRFALPVFAVDEGVIIDPNKPKEEKTEPLADKGYDSTTILLTIGYIVFIGGLAAFYWYYKKRVSIPRGGKKDGIIIAETKALGNKQYLVVAEYEERRFFLGVGPGFINQLSELEPYQKPEQPVFTPPSPIKGGKDV